MAREPVNNQNTPKSNNLTDRQSKKTIFMVILIVLLILAISGGYVWYKSNHKNTKTSTQQKSSENEAALRNYKQQVVVNITKDGYSPEAVIVPNDTRVNWQNIDSLAHSVRVTPGTKTPNQFDVNNAIAPGGGYPYIFHNTGTYNFFDSVTPTHNVQIIVK